jgi:hypothetical protein
VALLSAILGGNYVRLSPQPEPKRQSIARFRPRGNIIVHPGETATQGYVVLSTSTCRYAIFVPSPMVCLTPRNRYRHMPTLCIFMA